jgi:predicted dehydrogenase
MGQHIGGLRIGIIGFGRAALAHFDALRQLPGVEVAAAMDVYADGRLRAREAGLVVHDDIDTFLADGTLDAAVVCTPPVDHAPLAIACLERGLHVMCEKPLALTTWDVLTMLQAANRTQRRVIVASKFRHVPEVIRVAQMLADGELGDPVSFEVSFCSPVSMAHRWNAQRRLSGGGVIIDNGCHAFDIVSFLFGAIRRVHATKLKALQSLDVEDSATIQVWAGDGVVGKVDVSWSLPAPRDSYLVVRGSRATVEVGWQSSRLKVNGDPWREFGGPYDKNHAHRAMHARFLTAVAEGSEPWITTPECLQAAATVDAAYRSLESGASEWVAIQGTRELSLVSWSTSRNEAHA